MEMQALTERNENFFALWSHSCASTRRRFRTTIVESFRRLRKCSKPRALIRLIAPGRQERKVRNRVVLGAVCAFARVTPIGLRLCRASLRDMNLIHA
jgi:hypothetical protein